MYFNIFFDIDEMSEIALLVAALLLRKCGKDGLSSFIEFIPVSSYIYHYLFGLVQITLFIKARHLQ